MLRFATTMADSSEIETRLRGLLSPGKPAFTKPATLIALTGLGVVALSVLGLHSRSQPVVEATRVEVAETIAVAVAPTAPAAPEAPAGIAAVAYAPDGSDAERHKIAALRLDAEKAWKEERRRLVQLLKVGSPEAELVESRLKVQRETYEALLRREQDLGIQRSVGAENWPARTVAPSSEAPVRIEVPVPAAAPPAELAEFDRAERR